MPEVCGDGSRSTSRAVGSRWRRARVHWRQPPRGLRHRAPTVACHSRPHSAQRHQTLRVEWALTAWGSRSALRVGCHSATRSGRASANVCPPGPGRIARHAGQPTPLVRTYTLAYHSWPQSGQRHHSLRPDRAPSLLGSIPGLRVACSSAAISGCLIASEWAASTTCAVCRLLSRAH